MPSPVRKPFVLGHPAAAAAAAAGTRGRRVSRAVRKPVGYYLCDPRYVQWDALRRLNVLAATEDGHNLQRQSEQRGTRAGQQIHTAVTRQSDTRCKGQAGLGGLGFSLSCSHFSLCPLPGLCNAGPDQPPSCLKSTARCCNGAGWGLIPPQIPFEAEPWIPPALPP